MRALYRTLLVLTVWSICTGCHWDLIQVFAWAKMFADNAGEMSYREAASRALDPGEACQVCHFVAAATQDERTGLDLSLQAKEKQPLLVLISEPLLSAIPSATDSWVDEVADKWEGLGREAPTPPPRAV